MPESDLSAEHTVGYNSRAFTIDGQPEIFLSACIHYFRVPHELWADRIAKAKRGGMNTIETYVAWNFHEPEQGRFDFSGDRDLGVFLDECARQGMYVIVRPGPYICAEWDFGGFPNWLINVPGLETRRMNSPYLDAVAAYFDAVVPIIAARQWTTGDGTVVLVQVENEYANLKWTRGEDMVVDDEYQHWVRDGLLARGITVPLLSCAGYCSGTVEGVNSHNPGDLMPAHRQQFPDKPLFSTEFWTAWYDAWGQPHHTRSATDIEYASLRCWAEGACGYNYYVYHGGTNFGYTPMYIQTTSYDYDAQVSETGRLTDKWRASRRVAQFAHAFKHILLYGEHRRELSATDGLRVSELRTREDGAILFVDNPDEEKTVTGSVPPYLPEVTLSPRTLLPWVHDAPIGHVSGGRYLNSYAGLVKSDVRILTAHVRPDPQEGARVFVYGEPGESGEVVLFNGGARPESVEVTFDAEAPRVYPVGPSQIIALSREMAGRTWLCPTDDNAPVLIGAEDVREHTAEYATVEVAPGQEHTLFALDIEGRLTDIDVVAPALPAPPALDPWQTRIEPDYAAPGFDDSDWTTIDEPTSMIALGNGSNAYGWYRATVESPDTVAGATIRFDACSDRLTLFVNGVRVGASEIPPEDRRGDWVAEFDIDLRAGTNTIAVLADNLGLIKGDWQIGKGQEQEKKGIHGPVTITHPGTCYQLDVAKWRFHGLLHGEREGWWKGEVVPAAEGGSGPVRWCRATFTLDAPLDTATPLLVRMDGMGKGVLWLNGHNLGRYWQPVGPQRDYYAPEPWLNVGENVLVIAETEGAEFAPEQISLVWDEKSAAVVRVALS